MRFTDKKAGWVVEGKFIASIPAGQHLTDDEMLAYYHLQPGDARFADHAKGSRWMRVVLQKLNGNFVIAPINPNVSDVTA
jgi:hypothetical protein